MIATTRARFTAPATTLSPSVIDTIEDLVRRPGLYAGQYDRIEAVPRQFVEYRGNGAEWLLGVPHAYPTDAAHELVGSL